MGRSLRMRNVGVAVLVAAVLCLSAEGFAAAFSSNFDDGKLPPWAAAPEAGVTVVPKAPAAESDKAAQIADTDSPRLYAPIKLDTLAGAKRFKLEFDFCTTGLSKEGFCLDFFVATLYFGAEPTAPTPDFLALLDADSGNAKFTGEACPSPPSNYAANASVTDLADGWRHYSVIIDTPTDPKFVYAIPEFDVLDANAKPGDSSVRIDNVTLTPVAEGDAQGK